MDTKEPESDSTPPPPRITSTKRSASFIRPGSDGQVAQDPASDSTVWKRFGVSQKEDGRSFSEIAAGIFGQAPRPAADEPAADGSIESPASSPVPTESRRFEVHIPPPVMPSSVASAADQPAPQAPAQPLPVKDQAQPAIRSASPGPQTGAPGRHGSSVDRQVQASPLPPLMSQAAELKSLSDVKAILAGYPDPATRPRRRRRGVALALVSLFLVGGAGAIFASGMLGGGGAPSDAVGSVGNVADLPPGGEPPAAVSDLPPGEQLIPGLVAGEPTATPSPTAAPTATPTAKPAPTKSPAPQPTVVPTPPPPTPPPPPPPTPTPLVIAVHVGNLEVQTRTQGSKVRVAVTITVHGALHNAVAGAMVSGQWAGGSGPTSCFTDATGTCQLETGPLPTPGGVNFTVTGISYSAAPYNQPFNHDADGDSDGTSIGVVF